MATESCSSAWCNPSVPLLQAMKYLSWVLYPLVIGYGIYSLIYEPHKSWYSWLLNSLVGAVYTFGFILMCPQVGAVHPSGQPCTAANA
jgi:hypothetical protein